MAGLLLKNVSKAFGSLGVLNKITLELDAGELLVLLGPSGCGKTSLLRLIAGLESLDHGEIYINDQRVDRLPPKKRQVAMVFQNYSLYPHMTVEKNLAFPLTVSGVSRSETKRRVAEVAGMLGLSDKLKDRPASLSGGQRQRVALGRAVIRQPSLFLLDEPLSNLDADLRVRMRQEIVRIQKRLGVTTVHVTHDQSEALTMADRIALLHRGTIVQVGKPEELYRNPNSLFVARFVGHPPVNLIEARVERSLLIPFGLSLLNDNVGRDIDRILVGLRPEAIEIDQKGDYKAIVKTCEYLGDQYVATLSFTGRELVVSGNRRPLSCGETVNFSFDQKDLLYFDPNSSLRVG